LSPTVDVEHLPADEWLREEHDRGA